MHSLKRRLPAINRITMMKYKQRMVLTFTALSTGTLYLMWTFYHHEHPDRNSRSVKDFRAVRVVEDSKSVATVKDSKAVVNSFLTDRKDQEQNWNDAQSWRLCYPGIFDSSAGWRRTSSRSVCSGSFRQKDDDRPPLEHLFFLKTHKTGSQTLATVFNRYALTHNLTVAIRKDLTIHKPDGATHNWISDIVPLPPGVPHYDMLTDHVRFNEQYVRHFLPRDTVFVAIVREPFENFVSAFFFYRDIKRLEDLVDVPEPDPILTYLSNLSRWDTFPGHNTHSRMFFDFGLDFDHLNNDPSYLQNSLRNLSQVFHLVMLLEHFDESIVLLKRMMAWELKDLLYVKMNAGKTKRKYNFTRHHIEELKKHREEEFALYAYFRDIFVAKLAAQDETFFEEVKVFKGMRKTVEKFCNKVKDSTDGELVVEATRFSHGFRVSFEDCQLLKRESSSIKDVWFEELMMKRLEALGKSKISL